jgi:hypothetical protein
MAIGVVTLVAIISRYDDVSLQSATRAAGLLAQGGTSLSRPPNVRFLG